MAGYYRTVGGVRVDRRLYDDAPDELTLRSVVELLGRMLDADTYTAVEYATLEVLLKRPATPAARAWLRSFLRAYNPSDWKKPKRGQKVAKKVSKKSSAKAAAKKKTSKKKTSKKKTSKKKASKKKTSKKAAKKTSQKARGKQTRIPGT